MSFRAARLEWERDYWGRLVRACRGNLAEASRRAGVHRNAVYPLLRRLGLITEPPIRGRCGRKNRRELQIHYGD
jgi:DNA-binding NtrC family response regulator